MAYGDPQDRADPGKNDEMKRSVTHLCVPPVDLRPKLFGPTSRICVVSGDMMGHGPTLPEGVRSAPVRSTAQLTTLPTPLTLRLGGPISIPAAPATKVKWWFGFPVRLGGSSRRLRAGSSTTVRAHHASGAGPADGGYLVRENAHYGN